MKGEEKRTSMNSNNEEIKFRHSRVNDLILSPFFTEQRIQAIKDFTTKPGDVFIVGYPKSGTHWVVEIIKQIAKPAMPEGKNEELSPGADSIPFFELNNPEHLAPYPSPRYMYTHLPYALIPHNSQHNLKYIFIARNPRDVAVSYFHFMRQGVVGDWQNYFSDEQLEKLTKLYDSRMEGTGLDFEFTE